MSNYGSTPNPSIWEVLEGEQTLQYYQAVEQVCDYTGWKYTDFMADYRTALTQEEWVNLCNNAGIGVDVSSSGVIKRYFKTVETATGTNSTGLKTSTSAPSSGKFSKTITEQGEEIVDFEPLPENATEGGTNISGGGANVVASSVLTILGIAEALGFLAKDFKENYEWYEDISDSWVENGIGRIVSASQGKPSQFDYDLVDLGVRRLTDSLGITQNYSCFIDDESITGVITALDEAGVFDIEYEYETETLVPNSTVTMRSGGADLGYIRAAINQFNINKRGDIPIVEQQLQKAFSACKAQSNSALMDCIAVSTTEAAGIRSSVGISLCQVNGRQGTIYNGQDTIYAPNTQFAWVNNVPYINATVTYDGTIVSEPIIQTGTARLQLYLGHTYYIDNPSLCVGSSAFTTVSSQHGGSDKLPLAENAIHMVIPQHMPSVNQINQVIHDTFPDWYNESYTETEYDPLTDTEKEVRYYPISLPDARGETLPDSFNQSEAQNGKINPQTEPYKVSYLTNNYYQYITNNSNTYNPTPNPTPDPYVPEVEISTASALFTIYNPTMNNLNDLGTYLWNSTVIETIEKFFSNNPLDAIISLHQIYVTPIIGNGQHIYLGYLDSNVVAPIVTEQYVKIDCGSVTVPLFYNDVRDYSPYTQVDVFLPFIGIRNLKTEDVIGCTVSIEYVADVITGAILCNIYVTKRGATQILYTFSGNCSVQIPLSGADRTRLLSGIASGIANVAGGAIAGGVAGGIPGAIAGAVGGAVGSIGGFVNSTNIDRTGTFSANAGAMGVKKPYIIVNRKSAYDATRYNTFYGYPSNTRVTLNTCKGFTKILSVHVDNINNATQTEKNTIDTILKEGVIIQ